MAALSRRLRWGVFLVGLDPVEGHEQGGRRRALVVSYEPFHGSGLVTVCPITAAREVRYPNEVGIPAGEGGQTEDGVVLCHQVRTISVQRMKKLFGYVLDGNLRQAVRGSLAAHLGLNAPPEADGSSGAEFYTRP